MPSSTAFADQFNWSRFNLRVTLAVFALTAFAVVMFIAIHQYLADVVEMNFLSGNLGGPLEVSTEEVIINFLANLLVTFRPGWVGWVIAIGGPLGALIIARQRLSTLHELGGAGLAEELGARFVEREAPGLSQVVLCEQVAMVAAVRGMKPPPVYVLDLQNAVTAATLGTTPSDAVLVVSSGALAQLDPDALGAMMAWQLTAFDAGRIERDVRIAARLHPLTLPWLLGDRLLEAEDWLRMRYNAFADTIESTPAGRLANWPIPMYYPLYTGLSFALMTLRRMVRVAGFPGLAMARLILQENVRSDCELRDREVGREPQMCDALAAVFDAAAHSAVDDDDLDVEFVRAQLFAVEFAHCFCAEPAYVPQGQKLRSIARRLACHPDPTDRINYLAPQFDHLVYAHASARRAAQRAQPESMRGAAQNGAKSLNRDGAGAMQGPRLAPSVSDYRVVAAAQAEITNTESYQFPDPSEDMACGEFFLRFRSELLGQLDMPQLAGHVILAACYVTPPDADAMQALASRISGIAPNTLTDLRKLLDVGGKDGNSKLSMRQRRWLFERALTAMQPLSQELRATHIKNQRAVIEADKRVTLEELFDWLTVSRILIGANGLKVAGTAQSQDVVLMLAVMSQAGAVDANAAAAAFARGRDAAIMPTAVAPERAQLTFTAIEQSLMRLARAESRLRTVTVKACYAAAREGGAMREEREELLRRLCAVLDCPASMLLPSMSISPAPADISIASSVTAKSSKEAAHSFTAVEKRTKVRSEVQSESNAETDPESVRVAAGDSDGLPITLHCKCCDGRMVLRRKLVPISQVLVDWALPALAALLASAVPSYICADMQCGPVGWTMVIVIFAAVLFWSASIMDSRSSPISGMDFKRSTQIRWLYAFYTLILFFNLYAGASLGVWVAEIVTFGGMLTYLLQSKPSGRNLFYQCSKCAVISRPPKELVSGL